MSLGKNYIHYNPNRVDYAVSDFELESIKDASANLWKDVCLVAGSIGLPVLINACSLITKQTKFELNLDIFLNLTFGILGLILSVIFGIAWKRTSNKLFNLIAAIKSKPKVEINPDMIDVGKLPGQPEYPK